jgi:hypothetical protein
MQACVRKAGKYVWWNQEMIASWAGCSSRHRISSRIEVRRWLRVSSFELVHECPTTSLCGPGDSVNVRGPKIPSFQKRDSFLWLYSSSR